MYERSAIVLERYFNSMFGFDKKVNLKTIYKDYKDVIEEIQKYQIILEEEDKVINEFDEVANEIRKIQQEYKRINKSNIKGEEDREQLFSGLDESPDNINKNLSKIEEIVNKNNERLVELREKFVDSLTKFNDRQKERNKYSKNRREEEKNHIQIIEKIDRDINDIDVSILKKLKEFVNSDAKDEKEEIIDIMINNGRDERVPFDSNVIENAVKVRNDIAKKELECYLIIYEKMKRLLLEINKEEINLDKYKKTLRDVSVKLAFLKAQKIYIVSFLDNERMTIINGLKVHKQLMLDACENFELDMEQFNNLYELILREISGKSTKKAYKELYNKEYLKNIEEKEKNFEKEINNIKIKTGTIINSNYWRIEEIKNIYEVFQNEVSKKFEKDLSDFKLEETEEIEGISEESEDIVKEKLDIEDDIFKKESSDDTVEYIEEYEEDYDDEDYYNDYDNYDEEEFEYDEDFEDENEEYIDEDSEDFDDVDNEDYDNRGKKDNKLIENHDVEDKRGLFNKFFKK